MMRRRGGPGVVSTMARTAVVAGTATKVSNKVSAKDAAKAQARQEQAVASAAEQDLAQTQAQLAALQAQQADRSALGDTGAMLAHLEQLGKLKEAGVLTDEEFAAAKAKLLGG